MQRVESRRLLYAARLRGCALAKVRVRVKSSGVIDERGTALPIQLQLARADKHGEPAQPQEPEDAQGALPPALGLPEKELGLHVHGSSRAATSCGS